MLPLHHDPGRDTSCRGMRLIQLIASVLATTFVKESGRPDSNRRSQAPRACGLARLSHALIVLGSSPCGSRTHLSALKGRYPPPIDERASFQEWAGGRSNPRLPGFNRPLDRLSYRPENTAGQASGDTWPAGRSQFAGCHSRSGYGRWATVGRPTRSSPRFPHATAMMILVVRSPG